MQKVFSAADILLPNTEVTDMTRWSVIACDQFTSEPQYWDNVRREIDGQASTLELFLPEIYLSESESKIPKINAKMAEYERDLLVEHKNAMIYVRRRIPDGRVREGVVGKVDLEAYSYEQNNSALVRATEQTVLERIPPRVKIRVDAKIELPHIMMLFDDPEDNLFSVLRKNAEEYKKAYAFPLMQGAGDIEGYFISDSDSDFVSDFIESGRESGLCLCVGDGNHSLASAKALYEKIKAEIGEDGAKVHPSRYALCEIVNIHSAALDFEPIHRLVSGCDVDDIISFFERKCTSEDSHILRYVSGDRSGTVRIDKNAAGISVDPLQKLLDEYLSEHKGDIDYIHGDESLLSLSKKKNSLGIFCEPITKQGLFSAVKEGGSLPRKTFSMGVALEKRHYLEARKIK